MVGRKEAPVINSEYFFEMNSDIEQVIENDHRFHNRKILAEKELAKIILAINQLDEIDRRLLYDKYMNKNYTTNIAIYMNYYMSESKFYRELDNVLVKFENLMMMEYFWWRNKPLLLLQNVSSENNFSKKKKSFKSIIKQRKTVLKIVVLCYTFSNKLI